MANGAPGVDHPGARAIFTVWSLVAYRAAPAAREALRGDSAVIHQPGWFAFAPAALLGTSHPRDRSLAALTIPVSKIVGTRDGLASPAEVKANAHLLPAATSWIWVEGGNHSQFGWYGFQPGDRRAKISPKRQHDVLTGAVLAALETANVPPRALASALAADTANREDP